MTVFKNILVTGGAGYIGSHVCHLLIDKGYNVTCIDNLITGHKRLLPKKVKFEQFDISDRDKVSKLIKKKNFDLVMHFAGLISVEESVKRPVKYWKNNFLKGKIFLDTCYENNIKNIIYSSTASVYGNLSKKKFSEKNNLYPTNLYASSKLELENYIIKSSKKYNAKYIILRYFNVAGADPRMRTGEISKVSTHLIKIASEVAIGKRKKLIIFGDNYNTPDGTAVRDYIHVSDLADIHLKVSKYLMSKRKSQIFNCGYGKGVSVKNVTDELKKILKNNIKISFGPRRDGDNEISVSNTKKFNTYFSWKPKYNNLSYIIKTAIEWEKRLNKKN